MEQWEIDLRARLDKEVPDGAYQIGSGKWIVWTGKLGYINYLVELRRHVKNNQSLIEELKEGDFDYHVLHADKLKEIFKALFDDERKKT